MVFVIAGMAIPITLCNCSSCVQSFKADPQLEQLPHTVIASWYQRRGYITAMADLIHQSLQQFQEQVSRHLAAAACTVRSCCFVLHEPRL